MSENIFGDDNLEDEILEANEPVVEETTKKKKKEKSKNKPWVIALIAEIIVLALLSYALVNTYINKKFDKVTIQKLENVKVNEDLPQETLEKMETGFKTIALFGVDSRDIELSESGSRSDTIIIACINYDTGEVKLASVYRDTYLELANSSQSYEKVTHAYAYGGAEQAVNTLNKNLDLNITDYVTVNFTALTEAIDALGGLDIELKSSELSKLNECIDEQMRVNGIQSSYVYDTGVVHLDGVQSTAYARIRSTDQGDITRAWRQRKVLNLMVQKMKTAGLSSLNSVIDAVVDDISTSLSKSEILKLATTCFNYDISSSLGFPFTWATPTLSTKGSIVAACDLENNVTILHRYLFDDYDYEPSQTVKNISAQVSSDTGYYNQIDLDTYTIENDEESICD